MGNMRKVVHTWEIVYEKNNKIFTYEIDTDDYPRDIGIYIKELGLDQLNINDINITMSLLNTDVYKHIWWYNIKRYFKKHIRQVSVSNKKIDTKTYKFITVRFRIKNLDDLNKIEEDLTSEKLPQFCEFEFNNYTKDKAKKDALELLKIKYPNDFEKYVFYTAEYSAGDEDES